MGCGASGGIQVGVRKYRAPIETPVGDLAPEPKVAWRAKPARELADTNGGTELAKTWPLYESRDEPEPEKGEAAARTLPRLSPTELRALPRAPGEPKTLPHVLVKPLRRRDSAYGPEDMLPKGTAGTVWGPGVKPKEARPSTNGMEGLIARQHTTTAQLQAELCEADLEVKANSVRLRELIRGVNESKAACSAARAEIKAALAGGPAKPQYETMCALAAEYEQQLKCETEKVTRWVTLSRALQGKLYSLALEGIVEPVTGAGILALPEASHMRGSVFFDESESD